MPGKDEQRARAEPCKAAVAGAWSRQREHVCAHPLQAKACPSAGGSWAHMKALAFILNSHQEDQWTCDGLSTQWGVMPHPHSSASFAASSLNTASSRQVPWKHLPPPMSHVWSTASLISAFGNLFTLGWGLSAPRLIIAGLSRFIIAIVLNTYRITKHLPTSSNCLTRKWRQRPLWLKTVQRVNTRRGSKLRNGACWQVPSGLNRHKTKLQWSNVRVSKGVNREKRKHNSNFLGKQKETEKQNNAWYYEMAPCASGETVAH